MKFAIYTLQSTLFEGEVTSVTVPTLNGAITILNRHLPLVTIVSRGVARAILPNGEERAVSLEGGVLEVRPASEVVILADEQAP